MADAWAATIKDWAGGNAISESNLDQEIRDRWTVFLAAMDGDTSGTTVKHRHKVGTLAARPTPGESGRIYFPTDISLELHDDGTEWHIGPAFPTNCVHFFDEFILGEDDGSDLKWKTILSGTGAINQVDAHGGALQLNSGTTSASNARMLGNSSGGGSLNPAKIHLQFIIVTSDHPANTEQNLLAGMVDTIPAGDTDPTDGIFLKKTDAGNWFGVCRNSGTSTTQDMGGTFAAETVVIIERTSTGVNFYKDTWNAGGLQGAEITTNIPTATLLPGFRANNTTTASERAITVNANGLWSAR